MDDLDIAYEESSLTNESSVSEGKELTEESRESGTDSSGSESGETCSDPNCS